MFTEGLIQVGQTGTFCIVKIILSFTENWVLYSLFCLLFFLFQIMGLTLICVFHFHFDSITLFFIFLSFQGLDLRVEEPPLVRSPLIEKIGCDPFPKYPLSHRSFNGETFMSPPMYWLLSSSTMACWHHVWSLKWITVLGRKLQVTLIDKSLPLYQWEKHEDQDCGIKVETCLSMLHVIFYPKQ